MNTIPDLILTINLAVKTSPSHVSSLRTWPRELSSFFPITLSLVYWETPLIISALLLRLPGISRPCGLVSAVLTVNRKFPRQSLNCDVSLCVVDYNFTAFCSVQPFGML